MLKLLDLVKTYDEFKSQAPKPAPAENREQEGIAPPTDGNGDATTEPAVAGARDLELVSNSPEQPAQQSELEIPATGPDGVPIASPGMATQDAVAPLAGKAATRESGSADAAEFYKRVIGQVSRLFEAAAMETISPGRLLDETARSEQIASELARAPHAGEALLVKALGTYPEGTGFVVPHSANVAILAAYVGQELGLEGSRLTDTCLAGLTHDLGNVKLADGMLYKEGSLSPQEWDELRKRPSYTREILDSLGDRFSAVAQIAHQVYERMDGSGYPTGIEGEQILPEARILGAVDFFETVVHPRPYRDMPAQGVSYGLQTLMRMAGEFGQETLKALVRSVGLFPVGTYVRLSTGEIGRVLSSSKRNPMRPVVQVILDKKKRRARMPRSIDLVHSPHLYVSKPLSSSDLDDLGLLDERNASTNEQIQRGLGGSIAPDLPSDFRDEPGSSVPE